MGNRIATSVCQQCGTAFEHRVRYDREVKYCSRACSGAAQRKPQPEGYVQMACEACGAQFSYRPAKSATQRRYCSRACFGTGYSNAACDARTKACAGCGKSFTPKVRAISHCSRACSNANVPRKPLAERACAICEMAYRPTSNRQRFCTGCVPDDKTRKQLWYKRTTEMAGGKPRRPRSAGVNLAACVACGSEFRYERRGERVIKYCSRACSNRHTGEATGKTQSRRETIPCAWCGDLVSRVPSHVRSVRIFCSRRCSSEHASSGAIFRACRSCGDSFSSRSSNHRWCTPCREREHSRQARMIVARDGMTREDFHEAREYQEIIKRDPCGFCAGPAEAVDHIQAVASGGDDRWTNMAPICTSCNSAKGTLGLLQFLLRRHPSGDR